MIRMKIFKDIETTLISKWFNNQLDEIVNEMGANIEDENELISFVSERIENLIKEELSVLTEGYISEIVGNSFDNIDYRELVRYYKNNN